MFFTCFRLHVLLEIKYFKKQVQSFHTLLVISSFMTMFHSHCAGKLDRIGDTPQPAENCLKDTF